MKIPQHSSQETVVSDAPRQLPTKAVQRSASSFLTAMFIMLFICLAIVFAPPRFDSNCGLASLIDKHARLKTCKSPKIIFIGGSNVLMGLDSELVQRALHRDVVNMGLGASLGLRYQLEEVRDDVAQGDILVAMPEYCNFYSLGRDKTNGHFDGSSDLLNLMQIFPGSARWVWSVYTSSPSALLDGAYDLRELILLKVQFYKKILAKAFISTNQRPSPDLLKPAYSIYQRRNFNEFGDCTAHLNMVSTTPLVEDPILTYPKFDTSATDFLNEYNVFAKRRGASLVLLPPSFQRNSKSITITKDAYWHWVHLLTFPVLASPDRYTFEDAELFDSYYHTNAIGRRRRTDMVIEDLKNYITIQQHKL